MPPDEVKLPIVEAQTYRRFIKTHLLALLQTCHAAAEGVLRLCHGYEDPDFSIEAVKGDKGGQSLS